MKNLIGNTVTFICDDTTELGESFQKQNKINYSPPEHEDQRYFIGTVVAVSKDEDKRDVAAIDIEFVASKDQMYCVKLFDVIPVSNICSFSKIADIGFWCIHELLPSIKIDEQGENYAK